MRKTISRLVGGVALAALTMGSALAGELIINTDTSDPAPKRAMEILIEGFKKRIRMLR